MGACVTSQAVTPANDGPSGNTAGVREAAGLATLACALFVLLAAEWTFTLTPPSDPLEYVAAALAPGEGFPYLDRVTLWLWLRAFAVLPIAPEYIGPVATLAQTTLLLAAGVYWLSRKVALIAGSLFGGLYMLSPMILGIATYTFPIQLMTLCLLGVALASSGQVRTRGIVSSGAGMVLALLSKVQAGGVAVALLLRVLRSPERLPWLMLMIAGGAGALAILVILVVALDGPEQPARIVEAFFFGGAGETQFVGLATGGMPPFHYYLHEPTAVLAIIGMILPWIYPGGRALRIFSLFAVAQTLFLLAIYAITQRGGSLISNYSFDAMVFGLIAFSGVAGGLVQGRVTQPIPYLFVVGCYLVVETLARVENEAAQFYPQLAPKLLSGVGTDGLSYFAVIPILGLVTWGASKITRSHEKLAVSVLAGTVGVVVILAMLYSGKGPAYGAYHRNWALPYHQLAHMIMAETPPVCLDIRLGNATAETANWRMEWLLSGLYQRPHSFIGEVGSRCEIVYSDQLTDNEPADSILPPTPLGDFQYAMVRQDLMTSELQHFTVGSVGP